MTVQTFPTVALQLACTSVAILSMLSDLYNNIYEPVSG